MSFTVDDFVALRPFLYHVTSRENLCRLARTMRIEPAANLIARSESPHVARERRVGPIAISVAGETVVLKDQRPLVAANVSLSGDWRFPDFVQFLNEHVYLWPGNAMGPISHGRRFLDHYVDEQPLVVRANTRHLLAVNPAATPLFSPYNSGATRMQRGRPVARGPDLFKTAVAMRRPRHEVVEVVFREPLVLPASTEIRAPTGSWASLAR